MTQVRAAVAQSLKAASAQSTSHQVAPAAVIWLDPEGSWTSAIRPLQETLPLLTLGAYDPEQASGPAIWIRAVVASTGTTLPAHLYPHDESHPWVIYLPGVTPTDLAESGNLPETLRPLADLLNRSVLWQQSSRMPWHPHAFLRSKDGVNLNLDAREDTRSAVVEMLPRLLAEDVEELRRGPALDADRLRALALVDPVRTLLQWIDDPAATRATLEPEQWTAFTAASRSTYGLDPTTETPITAAGHLGRRLGSWQDVWERFAESADRYPTIPTVLNTARPAELFTVDPDSDPHPDSWPSWHADQERDLAAALTRAGSAATAQAARAAIAAAYAAHGSRATSLWADLGRAPLAVGLGSLSRLALGTAAAAPSGTVAEVAAWYATTGHEVDALAIATLDSVTGSEREALRAAVAAVYDPWVDEAAAVFQHAAQTSYPGQVGLPITPGTCVVFVDALRFDLAARLRERLEGASLDVATNHRITAFPSVTPTGQPAVAPVDPSALGWTGGPDFCAADATGHALKGQVLRKALATEGVAYLEWSDLGTGSGAAWTQMNTIDSIGHSQGRGLVDSLDNQLDGIATRIRALLQHSWSRVVVVTDHGFLLPAGEPRKVDLPLALTEGESTRKPRVARLRPGGTHPTYPTTPWTWDPSITFVSPPGAAVFVGGPAYEHGGLSPQECVTPVLTVTLPLSPLESALATITAHRWINQRCRVDLASPRDDLRIEVRLRPGDGTSRVGGPKAAKDGEANILVDETDAPPGTVAHIVVLGPDDAVIAQQQTIVGENP